MTMGLLSPELACKISGASRSSPLPTLPLSGGRQHFANTSLRYDLHVILGQGLVIGDQRQLFASGLGDEHAIEWVAVVHGELAILLNMAHLQGQNFIARRFDGRIERPGQGDFPDRFFNA